MKISNETIEQRRKSAIDDKTADLLVKQISHELYNHNLYRTFANYFAVKGLDKLETYYIGRANEELLHHQWIVDRLDYADVEFKYPAVEAVTNPIKDNVDTFSQTLDKEIETTQLIYNIVSSAKEANDWETFNWLQETLVKEQTEEEHISRKYLKIAAQEDVDWVTKADTILTDYESAQAAEGQQN
ncbi:ferritin [Methanobrevibacter sp. DSM 116169]|uniref:ferritin n=1 Tax=Methanobrevibacter sp. DSM 116169 TaxID=3242727 RepID=UPI0038FC41FF